MTAFNKSCPHMLCQPCYMITTFACQVCAPLPYQSLYVSSPAPAQPGSMRHSSVGLDSIQSLSIDNFPPAIDRPPIYSDTEFHYCSVCKKFRSRRFHREHPLIPEVTPTPAVCSRCRITEIPENPDKEQTESTRTTARGTDTGQAQTIQWNPRDYQRHTLLADDPATRFSDVEVRARSRSRSPTRRGRPLGRGSNEHGTGTPVANILPVTSTGRSDVSYREPRADNQRYAPDNTKPEEDRGASDRRRLDAEHKIASHPHAWGHGRVLPVGKGTYHGQNHELFDVESTAQQTQAERSNIERREASPVEYFYQRRVIRAISPPTPRHHERIRHASQLPSTPSHPQYRSESPSVWREQSGRKLTKTSRRPQPSQPMFRSIKRVFHGKHHRRPASLSPSSTSSSPSPPRRTPPSRHRPRRPSIPLSAARSPSPPVQRVRQERSTSHHNPPNHEQNVYGSNWGDMVTHVSFADPPSRGTARDSEPRYHDDEPHGRDRYRRAGSHHRGTRNGYRYDEVVDDGHIDDRGWGRGSLRAIDQDSHDRHRQERQYTQKRYDVRKTAEEGLGHLDPM